jgi:hypothetical protein
MHHVCLFFVSVAFCYHARQPANKGNALATSRGVPIAEQCQIALLTMRYVHTQEQKQFANRTNNKRLPRGVLTAPICINESKSFEIPLGLLYINVSQHNHRHCFFFV